MGGVLHPYYGIVRAAAPSPVSPFPVVVDSVASAEPSATTSHTVDLPDGIASGMLLLMSFRVFDGSGSASVPSGWTLLLSQVANTRSFTAYRVADGNEGSSVTVSALNDRSAHTVVLIDNYDDDGGVKIEVAGDGTQTNNPPQITPTWGSGESLIIAQCTTISATFNSTQANITAGPSGYSGFIMERSGSGTSGHAAAGVAWTHVDAASENPGAFSTANNFNRANTVAIKGIW